MFLFDVDGKGTNCRCTLFIVGKTQKKHPFYIQHRYKHKRDAYMYIEKDNDLPLLLRVASSFSGCPTKGQP